MICKTTLQPASQQIYEMKYQLKEENENIESTFYRVADALSKNEEFPDIWRSKFIYAMENGAIPAGRILSNAGAMKYKPNTSLINCVVSESPQDSIEGIMETAKKAAVTLSKGCGIGYCFSSLRPKGSYINGVGAETSGSLSFMEIFNTACFTINSAGGRRGAQMGTHYCFHPDIEEFIKCKQENGRLRQFNLSVLITDEFMECVKRNLTWDLYFPIHKLEFEKNKDNLNLEWKFFPFEDSNYITKDNLTLCKIYKTINAKYLWNLILKSTYEFSEPGVIFIDRVNSENNLWFTEHLSASNPCVTGDTLVITREGSRRIESLIGIEIEVWNGYEWSLVTPFSSGVCEIFEVEFSNGSKIYCTDYHKFILKEDVRIILKQLKVTDKIQTFYYPNEIDPVDDIHVVHIKPLSMLKPVFCLTDKKNNSCVFNGVLTGNCGEQMLPENGSCLLGSINLTKFVSNEFTDNACFDFNKFKEVIEIFTRMLDNVVEFNGLPLMEQRKEIIEKRRHGMGFFGLGSTLTMLNMKYGDNDSINFTEKVSSLLAYNNYNIGLELGKEKGMSAVLNRTYFINEKIASKLNSLTPEIKNIIKNHIESIGIDYENMTHIMGTILWCISDYMLRFYTKYPELWKQLLINGCRFTHATTVPPTGTTALSIGNNASNGIEPSFSHKYKRNIIVKNKKSKEQIDVYSYELLRYNEIHSNINEVLPKYFITANSISSDDHLNIMSIAQKWIDSSISKTINVSTDITFSDFEKVYNKAYELGCKGCATFRFNPNIFTGVLVDDKNLKNTKYKFKLEDGTYVSANGNDIIVYDNEEHIASNLFDALKEGYYGKF